MSHDTKKDKIEKYNEKDRKTTLVKLGMRVSGFIIRDQFGNVIEKERKPKDKIKEADLPNIFKKILSSGRENTLNKEGIEYLKRRASEILHFFENHNSRKFVGSSLLIVVDNAEKSYDLRLIDFAHI